MLVDEKTLGFGHPQIGAAKGIFAAFAICTPFWLALIVIAGGVPVRTAVAYMLTLVFAVAAVWVARRLHSEIRPGHPSFEQGNNN